MISPEDRAKQDALTDAYMLVLRDIERSLAETEQARIGRMGLRMKLEELQMTHEVLVRQINAYKLLNLQFYQEQIDGKPVPQD